MAKHRFEKSEVVYGVLAVLALALLLMVVNIPSWNVVIASLNPVWQFLIVNLGVYIIFFFVFSAIASGKKGVFALKSSLATILGYMAFDLILPGYYVTVDGLASGGAFGMSATDYFFGYLWSSLGAHGWLLVILTYPVMFILMFGVCIFMVKDFVKKMRS